MVGIAAFFWQHGYGAFQSARPKSMLCCNISKRTIARGRFQEEYRELLAGTALISMSGYLWD